MSFTLITHKRDPKTKIRESKPYIMFQEGSSKVFLQEGKFYWQGGEEIKPADVPEFARAAYRQLPMERKIVVGFLRPKKKPTVKPDPTEYVEVVNMEA